MVTIIQWREFVLENEQLGCRQSEQTTNVKWDTSNPISSQLLVLLCFTQSM